MERWTQSKLGYYLDFVVAPLLMLAAFTIAYLHGSFWPAASSALAGFALWTYLEYWIHRSLLHRTFRREHWFHHKEPGGYVAAPPLLTAGIQVVLMFAALGALGYSFGAGLFLGLEAGYLAYIATHDLIHHDSLRCRWLRSRALLHEVHHSGAEANFGVITSVWDRVHGTHQGT